MRRRRLLSLVPALVFGCLPGCLSAVRTSPSETTATPDTLPPPGDASLTEFDAGDPFETRRVGDPSEATHHRAIVWNDDADSRAIGVRLVAAGTGERLVDAAPTFPAYGTFRVEVFRPADYVLDVFPPTESDRRLGIRREFVDCNDSETHVAVRPDGSVRARVISTAMACEEAAGVPATSTEG
ncbi:hypothetical protein [Halobellus sp. GM3]|uniref:hypothetical protein n=1 Tax=Halobellus sp. GM3 TaxID=3458410 RepID=UPI00403D607E